MKAGSIVGIGISWALLCAATALAHHSISAHYHREQSVSVEGVITEVLFRNPHAAIHLAVDGAAGAQSWTLEWDDTGDLMEAGFTSETLRPGDRVVVAGNPARDGTNKLFIRTLQRPADGLQYLDD